MTGSEPKPFHPEQIFRTLVDHKVDFLVIGGIAVQTHGHLRSTVDVDVVVQLAPENFGRLADALATMKAQLRGVDAHLLGIELDSETLAKGANFTLTTDFGDLDIFTDNVPGASAYEELKSRAVEIDLFGIEVRVVGRDDLIAMKRAAGRPQDVDDIAALTDPGLDSS